MSIEPPPSPTNVVILYGKGGLSDVGRHAIVACLERTNCVEGSSNNNNSKNAGDDDVVVGTITVLTQYPQLLDELNWNCGCTDGTHSILSKAMDQKRVTVVPINTAWKDTDLTPYLKNGGDIEPKTTTTTTTAIISCIGNRQPFYGHYDALEGNEALIRAMKKIVSDETSNGSNTNNTENNNSNKPSLTRFRVVVMSSCGINEDWPALEFFTIGRIAMFVIYMVLARTMYHDLRNMELSYRALDQENNKNNFINYLFIRPVGLSEDVKPINQWTIQTKKYTHPLSIEIAKLDVARYMVEEALIPTRNNTSVVIGYDATTKIERNTAS